MKYVPLFAVALSALVAVLGCSPSGEKVVIKAKPDSGGRYAVRPMNVGDKWEWEWEGTSPLDDGRKNVQSKGTQLKWIDEGERTPTHTVVLTREISAAEDKSKGIVANVANRTQTTFAVADDGTSVALKVDQLAGTQTKTRKILKAPRTVASVAPGQIVDREFQYADGTTSRRKTTYGEVKDITVPAGTFTCLSYEEQVMDGQISSTETGFYCPALDQPVEYTITSVGVAGRNVLTFKLKSTNVRPKK